MGVLPMFGPKCPLLATRKKCSRQPRRFDLAAGCKSLTKPAKSRRNRHSDFRIVNLNYVNSAPCSHESGDVILDVSVAADRESAFASVFRTIPSATAGRGRRAQRRIA